MTQIERKMALDELSGKRGGGYMGIPICKNGHIIFNDSFDKKNRCKKCNSEASRVYYHGNKESVKENVKRWASENREKRKKIAKKYDLKKRNKLYDCYIRSLLGINKNDAPIEMIEIKRQQIELKREIKTWNQ